MMCKCTNSLEGITFHKRKDGEYDVSVVVSGGCGTGLVLIPADPLMLVEIAKSVKKNVPNLVDGSGLHFNAKEKYAVPTLESIGYIWVGGNYGKWEAPDDRTISPVDVIIDQYYYKVTTDPECWHNKGCGVFASAAPGDFNGLEWRKLTVALDDGNREEHF